MPDVIEQFGSEALLDVVFASEWKDFDEILEEPFKSQGFLKITKKGLKSMTTVPLAVQLTKDGQWESIREGLL